MLKWCPKCEEFVEEDNGLCVNCDSPLTRKKKKELKLDEWWEDDDTLYN